MFKTLANALKVKEIRRGLLFTFFIMVVVRLGSLIPLPGIDSVAVQQYLEQTLGESNSFLASFTGGSFTQMTIFALNVTPYITSSIIIQLLTIAIPALEEMQKDGDDGRKKLQAITRYVTILLSVVEGLGLAIGFERGHYLTIKPALAFPLIILVLTTGSAFVMWLGEKITEFGVGNGISIILLVNIISRIPADLNGLYIKFIKGNDIVDQVIAGAIILAVIVATVVLVILLQEGVRKIPVQHAQKVQGRRMVGGQGSFIPLQVNTSNVIPVIFASSILSVPAVVINLFGIKTSGTGAAILRVINQRNWFSKAYPTALIGVLIYVLLIVFFAYFYTAVTFNPMEIANNLKRSGGFIPGIRPGKPTQDYINKILNYIVFVGACGLIIVALIPIFFNGWFGADVSFGGTSLIIIVGVVIETIKQIESRMIVRNYSGFLTD